MSDRSQLKPGAMIRTDRFGNPLPEIVGHSPEGAPILRPVVLPDSFPSGLPDPVKRPAHYTRGTVEVIDFIDQTLDGYTDPRVAHYVGCAIKYLARAPHKGATQQDLEKAEWYLRRAINRVASKRG
jgi:hypothetical protein